MAQDSTTIANLLSQASAAHHDYEQNTLKGEYDEDWSTWYAEYVIDRGVGILLDRELTKEQLSLFFNQSNEEYQQENPQQGWADYTAQKLLASLH